MPLLAWKEMVRGSDGKKYRVTNVQIWRDGKAWREMVSHVEVPEEEHLATWFSTAAITA
tara:strand:+ start:861 stop:1037 length:177 start_codon:yes stop_codon:yes gene_type:complete